MIAEEATEAYWTKHPDPRWAEFERDAAARLRHGLLAEIGPAEEDAVRRDIIHPGGCDPLFHPTLSRGAMRARIRWFDNEIQIGWTASRRLQEAMGWAIVDCGPARSLFAPGAIDAWLPRGRCDNADLGPAGFENYTGRGWVAVGDPYVGSMLLAVGAPARLIRDGSKGEGYRAVVVPRRFAAAHLSAIDASRRVISHWRSPFPYMALAAAFRAARRVLGEDRATREQLFGFIMGIAGCGRPQVLYDINDKVVGIADRADFTPLLVAADWLEERAHAGIARNIRQVAEWLMVLYEGKDISRSAE